MHYAAPDALARARRIKLMIFDVDGVLTDGRLWYGPAGEALKTFHGFDGHGIKMLAETGVRCAILSGRKSPAVAKRAKEMGLAYDSSLMADEDCYELLLDGEPSGVVELPVEWVRDDAVYFWMNRFASHRPYTPPADVLDIFRREFERAHEEGGLFQLTMHPHVIGYRSRIWILEEIIRLAQSRPGVWFATHAEVAQWARQHAQ